MYHVYIRKLREVRDIALHREKVSLRDMKRDAVPEREGKIREEWEDNRETYEKRISGIRENWEANKNRKF
jgi:hypothetical protein